MQFRILGPLEVLEGQRRVELGRPKQRALLAVLLVHADQVVAVDRLIEELWGEQPPAQAAASLQAYVSNLRRALEPGRPARAPPRVLVTQPPGYRLALAPGDLDADRFQALGEEGHRLLEAGRPDQAAQVLREALGLWRGPALADVADEPFAQAERQRLEELRLVVLEDRLAAQLACGGHASAAAELGELVGRHPFRERLHGLLMLALYRSGRQAEALQAFQAARRTLEEELGIDPSPWLRQLEADILRQAPTLDWTAPPGEAGTPPRAETPMASMGVAEPAVSLPAAAGDGELVGRDEQLALLDTTLAAVLAGRGRLALLAGEPGIGKTRLAEEVARRAAARDIQVAWGRCYEGDGAPAFWPWVQIVRQLLTDVPPEQLGREPGPSAGELSQLLPELKELVPALEPPPVVDLAAARFRLYQAVTELLRSLGDSRPLLVVVDDLHWADVASLRLLEFLAAELRATRLGVLGTYRDVEVTVGHPLGETLGALARQPAVERISLRGLSEAEVARLITNTVRTRPVEGLVRAVHDRTEGNPFFITELLRLLQSEGRLADDALGAVRRVIPVGVRDVLQRRLARLPEQTNAVLLVAAVAGRDFDLDLVESVTRLDDEHTLETVEAAVVAGLVIEDDQAVGRYRFAHALVRETIYAQLSRARRARLHARVGQALVDLHGPDDPEHVLELAQHWWAAASVIGPGAALPHVLAAADHAMVRLAYEQTEQQLRRALELLASMPPSTERARTELDIKLQLGHLLSQLGGEGVREAAAVFQRAAELAGEVTDDGPAIPAIAGVHALCTLRAEHDRARALAERVLAGARRSGTPQALLAGHFMLGKTMLCMGELAAARHHLEEAVRLGASAPGISGLPGITRGLSADSLLEVALVLLGLPEQAAGVAAAVGRAVERSPHQPYPIASAMVHGAHAAVHRRDLPLLRERVAVAATLTERWGFRTLAADVTALLGWAQAMDGDPAGGARLLRQGIDQLASAGVEVLRPMLLGLLAEAEQLAGRPEEGLRLLDDALAQVSLRGERHCEAELQRLRGESLLAVSPPRATEAETAFASAIAVASRQGAKLLEARVVASLDRLKAARRPQSSR